MQVTALILAGGLGTRMGGADKGLVAFQGQRMIDHVLARLIPQVGQVLINANRNLASYQALGYPVLTDLNMDFDGPLAGMQVGLRHCTTPWLLTVPCDSPFLPDDLLLRLSAAVQAPGHPLAIARSASGNHPVFSLLHRDLLPSLEAFLAMGQRKVSAWQAAHQPVFVDFADDHAFTNINDGQPLASPPPLTEQHR